MPFLFYDYASCFLFSPSRLRELDLDAFADELARQDHGDKHITLYDIRKELNQRYRDYRDPFEPPTPEQIFSMITHETPETMHKGSLVECQVICLASRKPTQEQIDNANPIKNNDTGLWTCPFCKKEGFAQFGDVSISLCYCYCLWQCKKRVDWLIYFRGWLCHLDLSVFCYSLEVADEISYGFLISSFY